MFPIRCLIEAVDDDRCPKCSDIGSLVVSDSYAIVAGQTPLSQLVDTVLSALGLQHLGYGCKPMLQLKNWKPLTFDQISDEPDVEVETILKDVSNQLTLRILTKQSSTALQGSVNDLKDRLLRAILQKVPDLLSESQRTQWKEFLAQLALATSNPATVAQMNLTDLILAQKSNDNNSKNNTWLDEWSKKLINHQSIIPSALTENDISSLNKNATNSDLAPRPTPTTNDQQGAAPAITRFSPLLEIPKLEHWFRENANPSRQRLQQYVNILNVSNFRKHTSKVTYQQICNWFINARATSRRRTSRMMGQQHQQQRVVGQQGTSPQRADSGSQAPANGWPQKVFGNQVRNLSLAFNNFIKQSSSPASPSTNYNQNTSQNMDHLIGTDSSTPKNNIGAKNQPHQQQDNVDHQVDDEDQDQDEDYDDDCDNVINLSKNVVEENQQQNKSTTDLAKSKSPIIGASAVFINGGSVLEDDESKHFPKINCIPTKNGSLAEILVNGSHSDGQNSCSPNSLNNENPATAMTDQQHNSGSSPLAHGVAGANSIFPGTSPLNPVAAHHYQRFSSSQQQGNTETPFQQQQVNANRSRLMFDPLSELPMLEKWFEENPHPSWVQIDQITETLNNMPYRHTYPRVSSHNVKIWFKNRRAKSKRHLVASDAVKNEIDHKMYFS